MNPRAQRTAAELRARRMMGLAGRRRRLPRQIPPRPIEREYARLLLRYVTIAREAFAPLLAELPALLESARRERTTMDGAREDAGEARRARVLIEQAGARMANEIRPSEIEAVAERIARSTAGYQRVQLNRQIKAAFGADVFLGDRRLAHEVEAFVMANVDLIKDIPARVAAEVEQATTRAIQDGRRHEDLARDLEKRFGYAKDRAMLIARDQVGKLYGQINASRQMELGAEAFVWRTVNDERVRDEHAELEGQSFKYAEGGHPTEGLPGEAILCRCYAEPDFTAIINGTTE